MVMPIINNNKNRQALSEAAAALHGIVERARVCQWNDVKEGVLQQKSRPIKTIRRLLSIASYRL